MKVSLQAMRVNAKLTQKSVAAELKINPQTIVNWEKGKTFPDVDMLANLCKLYKCTMDDLFFTQSTR